MSPKISDLAFAAGAARFASTSTGLPNREGGSPWRLGSTSAPAVSTSEARLPKSSGLMIQLARGRYWLGSALKIVTRSASLNAVALPVAAVTAVTFRDQSLRLAGARARDEGRTLERADALADLTSQVRVEGHAGILGELLADDDLRGGLESTER